MDRGGGATLTKWYDTDCPVCSEQATRGEGGERHCENCGFAWDAALPEWQVIVKARDYAREQLAKQRSAGSSTAQEKT